MNADVIKQIVDRREIADFFECVVLDCATLPPIDQRNKRKRDPAIVANWILQWLCPAWPEWHRHPGDRPAPVTSENFGKLIDLMAEDAISKQAGKRVFDEMVATGKDPSAIIDVKGWGQVSDAKVIEVAVDAVLAAFPTQVSEYATNPKVLDFLVGQVMKATKGKAKPALVKEIVAGRLSQEVTV